jgi:hypothetical protein
MAKGIKLDDVSFEKLIVEALDDVEKDMVDVDANIGVYKNLISSGSFGVEQYGEFYNEALKLKGSLRDRVLKILTLMKDRIKTKEVYAMTKKDGTEMSAEDVKGLKDLIKEEELKNG